MEAHRVRESSPPETTLVTVGTLSGPWFLGFKLWL